jgi:citrate lyase subunit beta/citryl-CoA lyase
MDLMRSWLFVPGHKQRMVEKSLGLDVDAIMLDIEDGVPPAQKDLARTLIAQALEAEGSANGPSRFVRVNAIGHPRMEADLEAVLCAGLDGLVLPKVESVEEVQAVEGILNAREPQAGLEPGGIALLIAIESPKGLFQAPAIASCSPRVVGLMFGAEDFGRELGLPVVREREARELIYARSSLVLAAASAHVQAVDGVWPDLADQDGLWADTRQARCLGFSGKSLIHPSQIEAINTVFSPSPEEVEYCRQVIDAFDEAMARGDGSIAFGGQLIDLPIVERARRTLVLAEHQGISAPPSQE